MAAPANSTWIGYFGASQISYDGSTTTFTGNVQVTGQFIGPAADNTAAPPFSFLGDLNTGVGSAAADTLNLITGGTSRVSVSTTAVTSTLPYVGPAGTAAATSFNFGTAGTGFYGVSATAIGVAVAGGQQFQFDNNFGLVLDAARELAWGSSGVGSVDVRLMRGAANRLDLASGDSMNLVSGNYMHAGVAGFTGTGAYTNFTIAGGIITAAT